MNPRLARACVATALALAPVACGTSSSPSAPADGGPGSATNATPDAGSHTDAASPLVPSDGGAPEATDAAGALSDAGYGASATLGFASSTFTLYASIAGGPAHLVQLDTGSLGLYVPASVLGSSATVSTTTCSITYVSSGTTLSGHEATAPVALLGATSAGDVTPPPTTVPMTFCAVDDTTFTGGMMGVGFGRGTGSDPSRNVLLEMAPIKAGTMHAGFVLSTHPSPAVQIGLTSGGVAGFQTVALEADPSGNGDWVATSLRGCLRLPNVVAFATECGGLLVDTGVADCLLWGPTDPTLGGTVPSGQTLVPNGVALQIEAEAGAPTLDYSFVVGSDAGSPAGVSIRTASAFSINTGRALLTEFDYLFDAQQGLVGFRAAP